MGTDPEKYKLTMKDYMTLPVIEIVKYPDFDEKMFWVAMGLWTMPMTELVDKVDARWLNSLPS